MRCNQISFWQVLLCTFFSFSVLADGSSNPVQVRFVDSSTGYGIQPQVIVSSESGVTNVVQPDTSGRLTLDLENGEYTFGISSPEYNGLTAGMTITDSNRKFQFTLEPVTPPEQIRAENIIAQHRATATVFAGFVSGDDIGRALSGVVVTSLPSGATTQTDANGFFQLNVPLQSDAEWAVSPAKLIFEKNGYETDERQNIELAPYGDLIMRVSLTPGVGQKTFNEQGRRISPDATPYQPRTIVAKKDLPLNNLINPTNATVRIPATIRVLRSDSTIEYIALETYVARSINDEWIPSWGNLNGTNGINCLMAGTVANRSYAVSFIRSPKNGATTYDICDSTSCQVYDSDSSTATDNAANQTRGYVVIDSTATIARSEYSAENNSLGETTCGDEYTAPTSGCLYDPVCAGETRNGHGRGMCQWGTARWATGYRMNGPSSGDTVSNGYPVKDWKWIVNHYFPTLTLVKAQPFVVGDDVEAAGSVAVRSCAGSSCSLTVTQTSGETGTIIGGPTWNSGSDGYTWWQIQWTDGTTGWSHEQYLERLLPALGAPSGLTATVISTNRIDVSWTDTNMFEAGFRLERAYATGGPFRLIKELGKNVTSYSDTNLTAGNSYWYRVRAFNASGNSSYSNKDSDTTPAVTPVLTAVGNKTVVEGTALTFSASATASDTVQMLTSFEEFDIETTSGSVLFRSPRTSGSTTNHIDAAPDYSSVTELFPSGTGLGSRALLVSCDFTNATAPWVRLTTSSAGTIPNPVIDFTDKLRFNIYCDKSIGVALGLRETTNAASTVVGADGGTSGGIEWVGVTNKNGSAPVPNRVVSSGAWTTLTFDLPNEPCTNFANANSVLSTASGLGVLEHLAIVPRSGNGIYKIYLDNVAVVRSRSVSYSLDTGAPSGASINPTTGAFTWTPTEAQGPGSYTIKVIATASGSPGAMATNSFIVTVSETNSAPVLTSIANQTIHAGATVIITNVATDVDSPANTLSFSLDPGFPSGATINSATGVFTWTSSDANSGTISNVTVRVTDNGSPAKSDTKTFSITVSAKPSFQSVVQNGSNVTFGWNSISGKTYKIQYKQNLSDAVWTDLVDVAANGATSTYSATNTGNQRFYRIVSF